MTTRTLLSETPEQATSWERISDEDQEKHERRTGEEREGSEDGEDQEEDDEEEEEVRERWCLLSLA